MSQRVVVLTDEDPRALAERGAKAAWEHKTAHSGALCSWDALDERQRLEEVLRFMVGLTAALFPGEDESS